MSEQLCLQWNEYKENAIRTFGSLKEDKDFTDITLVCEDGKQIETHKVILANSSPFFQNILRKNKHIHPLIYMRGVKSEDLSAIVDFLYCGEAKVYQKNLDSFLAIAEELQLEGLKGQADNNEVKQGESFEMVSPKKGKVKKEFNFLKSVFCTRCFFVANGRLLRQRPNYPFAPRLFHEFFHGMQHCLISALESSVVLENKLCSCS